MQIKEVLDSPDFDLVAALRSHRTVLQQKVKRLQNLISTVDSTIMHMVGEVDMSKKRLFEAFSEEKQKQYEREGASKTCQRKGRQKASEMVVE